MKAATYHPIYLLAALLLHACDLEVIPPITCDDQVHSVFSIGPTECTDSCTVTFINNSTGANEYQWDFGDGNVSNVQNPAPKTYIGSGEYLIRLVAKGAGTCSDTSEQRLVIHAAGVKAAFDVKNNGCSAKCPVEFVNLSQNADSWFWDFKDGGTGTAKNPVHEYLQRGTYNVMLVASGNSGQDTAYRTVTIKQLPVAGFNINNDSCVAKCTPSFTNTSSGATSYSWDFGDPGSGSQNTSTLANPSHEYKTPGNYTVTLTAINVDGSATAQKAVHIASPYFKKLTGVNGTPLHGVQKNNGQYHVFYKQSGAYKSTVFDTQGKEVSTKTLQLTNIDQLNDVIPSNDGGFLLAGIYLGTNRAKVIKIGEDQSVKFNKEINFNSNSSISYGYGITVNASNQIALTGQYIPAGGGSSYPGLALLNQTGNVSTNIAVNNTNTLNIYGTGIAHLTSSDYMLTGFQFGFGGNPSKYLIRCSSSGQYEAIKNLGAGITLEKIVGYGANVFVLQKSSTGVFSVYKYDSGFFNSGSIALSGITVSDIIMANDGNLIVCGTKDQTLYLAKFNAANMSATPLWSNEYPVVGKGVSGNTIVQLADGGYFIAGAANADGLIQLYLVRTNGSGKVE